MTSYIDLLKQIDELKKENEYLKFILKNNNIEYENYVIKKLTFEEKLKTYISYFKGRSDVFTEKYISNGKKGYSFVCEHKNTSLCLIKKGVKKPCSICENRKYSSININHYINHLKGNSSYGIYPIVNNDKCYFLAIDFDDDNFKEASLAYVKECRKLGINSLLEISQSGNGCHVWIFFEDLVSCKVARCVGDYILLNAITNNKNISFKSYDRFFPSQDVIEQFAFGNCIALPLNGNCVRNNTSVFVNDNFEILPNQIEYLSRIKKVSILELNLLYEKIKNENIEYEIVDKNIKSLNIKQNDFIKSLDIILKNEIYISKKELTTKSLSIIKRLAVLHNPEYYEKQGKRLSTYGINRIIELFKEEDEFISIPRGTLDDLIKILKFVKVTYNIIDKRVKLNNIITDLNISLYDNQIEAINELLKYETGLLVAPTGSGKTIMGMEIINRLKKPSLILVDQVKLIEQWKERIKEYLKVDGKDFTPGVYYSSKKKLTGIIDIASLKSINDETDIFNKYEIIIGDEIHHVASITYEKVVRMFNSRYFYGFTATPKRSDHLEKIVYKSIGDVRYTLNNDIKSFDKFVKPRFTFFKNKLNYDNLSYSDLCSCIYKDEERNKLIVNDIITEYNKKRNIIVLTERIEHIDILYDKLSKLCTNLYKIKGTSNKIDKDKFNNSISKLESQYIIISTGKYLGEGFDLPSLNTLFLVMPFKWSGKLSQSIGRIERNYNGKDNVLVYDYVDIKIGIFNHQFQERLRGYKKEKYKLIEDDNKMYFLYSFDNYYESLKKEIINANKVIFLITYYNEDKLKELINLNGNIIVISDNNFNFEINNLNTKHSIINSVIINDKIIWYGSINPFSWAKKEDSIIRIEDSEYVKELLIDYK